MALVWCWGWEMNIDTTEFATVTGCSTNHATSVVTNQATSFQPPGGVGGGAVSCRFYSTTGRTATMGIPTAGQVNQGWVVFSYMLHTGDGYEYSENNLLRVLDASTDVIKVTADRSSPTNTATLKLYISGTLVGTSSNKIGVGTWHQIAVKFNASATGAAHTGSVYIDGVEAIASGNGGNPSAAYVIDVIEWWGAQDNVDYSYHDHTFIWSSLSDTPTSGTRYIDGLRPDGDTTTTDWIRSTGTDWYALVDDGTSAEFVSTVDTATPLLLTCANPSTSYTATVDGVQITNYCLGNTGGTDLEDMSIRIKHGSSYGGPTATVATAGATFAPHMAIVNPATTNAWTDAELDGISTESSAA